MIQKTVGICLRISPFSQTSHVVTWLTPDHGKVTTVIKGARRPKSQFLGQYDIGYSCDLLFYSRERNGTHIIRECSPMDVRRGLRDNWRAVVCASYLCDLALSISMPASANAPLYELLDTGIKSLCSCTPDKAFIFWFELKAMACIGLTPRLSACVNCDNDITGRESRLLFSFSHGGVLCPSCTQTSTSSSPVEPETLRALLQLQHAVQPADVTAIQYVDKQILEAGELLGGFLEYHAHKAPPGRRIATELVE